MDNLFIEFNPEPSFSELALLTDGISEESRIKRNQTKIKHYAYFLKDANANTKGGINGCALYGCLTIGGLGQPEVR